MRVAIVGAGVAGLAAARRLSGQGHEVVVYEQSRALGGRAATLRTNGCIVDHGAQYLKTPDDLPEVRRLVLHDLPRDGLLDIGRPVWTFDRAGRVAPGDPEQNAGPKWSYADGLDTLAKLLAAGLDVQRGRRVARVRRGAHGYSLLDASDRMLGEAASALIAIPAPDAIELLLAGGVRSRRRDAALAELQAVRYRSLLSITLGFNGPAPGAVFAGGTTADPRPYYALVNADRGHDVSWLAIENDKGPSRAPPGILVVVAQMGPAFSAAHFDDPEEDLAARAAVASSALLGLDLGQPLWHDVAHWRYALPDTTCSLTALNSGHDGLLFAGDYVEGGRVHLALQAGLEVAALLAGR